MDIHEVIERKKREIGRLERELEIQRAVLRELVSVLGQEGVHECGGAAASGGEALSLGLGRQAEQDVIDPNAPLPTNVRLVMKKLSRSVRVPDIQRELEHAGLHSKSLRGSIASALNRRDDLFKRVSRGKYKLIEPPG